MLVDQQSHGVEAQGEPGDLSCASAVWHTASAATTARKHATSLMNP